VFSGVLTENYLVSPCEPSTKTIQSTTPTSELRSSFVQSFENFTKILEEFKNMEEEEMELSLFCEGFISRMQGMLLLLLLLIIIIVTIIICCLSLLL
jgi:hypothetical protein